MEMLLFRIFLIRLEDIMEKIFEDYFSELQADMVSICLEYVEDRAEKVYIYCSFENNILSSGFFYKVNGQVVKKNRLNDVINGNEEEYDVSVDRQRATIAIINDDIKSLVTLCQKYKKKMPTQIKLTYDVLKNRLNADYCYETVFSNDKDKTAYDILEEWYNSEKNI